MEDVYSEQDIDRLIDIEESENTQQLENTIDQTYDFEDAQLFEEEPVVIKSVDHSNKIPSSNQSPQQKHDKQQNDGSAKKRKQFWHKENLLKDLTSKKLNQEHFKLLTLPPTGESFHWVVDGKMYDFFIVFFLFLFLF